MILLLATLACRGGPDTGGSPCVVEGETTLTLVDAWSDARLFGDALPEHFDYEKGPGLGVGDLDGDGWPDLILSTNQVRSFAFRNDGGALGLTEGFTVDGGPWPAANAVALADLDLDGDLDAVLARGHGEADLVLQNDGAGRFTSTPLPSAEVERLSPVVGDFNGDGRPDLFIGGFAQDLSTLRPGEGSGLYLQTADGGWVDATENIPTNPDTPSQDFRFALTYQAVALDADVDGDLDLYLSNDFGADVVRSVLLVNDGQGRFTPALDCGCFDTISAMGASVADVNGDALPDLFVSSFMRPPYLLYVNEGDTVFAKQTGLYMDEQAGDPDSVVPWGSRFVDLDLDGDLDLVTVFGPIRPAGDAIPLAQTDRIFLREGGYWSDRSEAVWTPDAEVGRAVAVGDFNRDGRPDLVTAGRTWMKVYRAEGGRGGGVTLRLDGARDPTGAQVRVEAGAQDSARWLLPGGLFSSSEPALFIGLGEAPSAARVTVTWPDGAEQVVEDVACDSELVLTYPG